jgi:hypothetical protein
MWPLVKALSKQRASPDMNENDAVPAPLRLVVLVSRSFSIIDY